jgi:hypothetical protein
VPRAGILLVGLLLALAPAAQAQVIADEFSDSYSFHDLEIIIARNGKPVARLVPVARSSSFGAIRGVWRGQVEMADDFDELPDDIAEAFGIR